MVCCSAPLCKSRSEDYFKLYRFPLGQSERLKIWIVNCRRDKWEPKCTSRLCEVHFESSQFETNRQDNRMKLKPNAIPTLFNVPNPPKPIKNLNAKRISVNSTSKLTSATLNINRASGTSQRNSLTWFTPTNPNDPSIIPNEHSEANHSSTSSTTSFCSKVPDANGNDNYPIPEPSSEVNFHSKAVEDHLPGQVLIDCDIREIKTENERLKKELNTAQATSNKCFSAEQLKALQTNRKITSSNESISNALKVRFALGFHRYNYLRLKCNPLSHCTSLNRRAKGIKIDYGIFHALLGPPKCKIDGLHPSGKDCIVSVDEFKISGKLSYDKSSHSLLYFWKYCERNFEIKCLQQLQTIFDQSKCKRHSGRNPMFL